MDYRKAYKEHYCIDFGSSMVVHHIDGDRRNNDISNLLLMPRDIHFDWHRVLPLVNQIPSGAHMYSLGVDARTAYSSIYRIREQVEPVWFRVCYWAEQKYIEDNCCPGSIAYAELRSKKEWHDYEQRTT